MTPTEFQNLKYGNILVDSTGRQLMVLHTNRDSQEKVTAIGVVEAFLPADAQGLVLSDSTSHETVLLDPNIGPEPKIIGILKTIPEAK
jgi:hypothetical protein